MNFRARSTFRAGDFARLEAALVPRIIQGATDGANVVLAESQGLVPVDTGTLKASGGVRVEWKGKTVVGYVTYTAPWAAYNEFGTGRRGEASGNGAPGITYDTNWPGMTGSPYLRPSLDTTRSQVLDAFKAALQV